MPSRLAERGGVPPLSALERAQWLTLVAVCAVSFPLAEPGALVAQTVIPAERPTQAGAAPDAGAFTPPPPGGEPLAVALERSNLQQLAEEARLEGSFARAVQLLDEASSWASDPVMAWKLRYQSALLLTHVPGASLEAAHRLRQLLLERRTELPQRLIEVAEREVLRLQGFEAQGEGYAEVLRLREQLQRVPLAARLGWLEAQAQRNPAQIFERARLQLLMETHWELKEWRSVREGLEQIARLEGGWKPALLDLHERARQEIRRQRLAWASVFLLSVAGVGVPWGLRGVPEWQRLLRQILFAVMQWALMLTLLYLYYVVGRQRGDVSPVTLPRLGVLLLLTGGAQALGLAWKRVLSMRASPLEARWGGLLLGILLPVSALYLFAYLYDYASVLKL